MQAYTWEQLALFARLAQERRGEETVSNAVTAAIGAHVGWTGKWQAIRTLAKRVKGSAGDGEAMRTIRSRLKGAIKRVVPGQQRRRTE